MFDFLKRTPSSQIDKLIKRLTETGGEDGPRIEAAEKLAELNTQEASYALLRRFTMSSKVISGDVEEKQMIVAMLVEKGEAAVEPILKFMKTQHQVEWPARALMEILPEQEWVPRLVEILKNVAQNPFTSPEHRTSLIKAMHGHVTPEIAATLRTLLEDDDDDVSIAAIQAIAELGEEVREPLLELFIRAENRPRIRIAIAELFADREWPVKGYRPSVEAALPEGLHLTAKGFIRRRGTPA
jgi:HEAT repeat protein